jgi:hypothetical protein
VIARWRWWILCLLLLVLTTIKGRWWLFGESPLVPQEDLLLNQEPESLRRGQRRWRWWRRVKKEWRWGGGKGVLNRFDQQLMVVVNTVINGRKHQTKKNTGRSRRSTNYVASQYEWWWFKRIKVIKGE